MAAAAVAVPVSSPHRSVAKNKGCSIGRARNGTKKNTNTTPRRRYKCFDLLDHASHKTLAYVPSNKFPMGSKREHTAAKSAAKSKAYAVIRQLYNVNEEGIDESETGSGSSVDTRGGGGTGSGITAQSQILHELAKSVPCGCFYMIAFNVLNCQFVKIAGSDQTVARLLFYNYTRLVDNYYRDDDDIVVDHPLPNDQSGTAELFDRLQPNDRYNIWYICKYGTPDFLRTLEDMCSLDRRASQLLHLGLQYTRANQAMLLEPTDSKNPIKTVGVLMKTLIGPTHGRLHFRQGATVTTTALTSPSTNDNGDATTTPPPRSTNNNVHTRRRPTIRLFYSKDETRLIDKATRICDDYRRDVDNYMDGNGQQRQPMPNIAKRYIARIAELRRECMYFKECKILPPVLNGTTTLMSSGDRRGTKRKGRSPDEVTNGQIPNTASISRSEMESKSADIVNNAVSFWRKHQREGTLEPPEVQPYMQPRIVRKRRGIAVNRLPLIERIGGPLFNDSDNHLRFGDSCPHDIVENICIQTRCADEGESVIKICKACRRKV